MSRCGVVGLIIYTYHGLNGVLNLAYGEFHYQVDGFVIHILALNVLHHLFRLSTISAFLYAGITSEFGVLFHHP